MPWIEKKHFYKDFMDSIMNAVQTIPHEKVVWFGVHRRMGLIMQDIIDMGGDIVIPEYNNWKFVPEAEVKQYIEKDRELLGVK